MKKFAPSQFSVEEEEDDVVLADHHPPLLPNNNLQIISCARRLNLPSILDHGSQASSSNSTVLDDHDGDEEEIPPVVYNPTPLRWFRPPSPDSDDQNNLKVDEEVDTTLRLFQNNPTPVLRPDFFDGVEDDDADTTLSLRLPGTTNPVKSRMQAKGKKRAVAVADDCQKKKRLKREDNEVVLPLLPIEQIPTLMKAVESRNGSSPTFLYRKILEKSDVERGQNRLLVTRRESMMEYLREKAAAVDDGGKGVKMVGVDGGGNVYDKLVLKRWPSTDGTVINSDWRKVVAANSAQKGDVVEIWGFRVDENPCLAFNFRRENAGSSGTTCIDVGTSQLV